MTNYLRHIYYNFLAINNNLILIFLLFGNSLIPNYFNKDIIKYKLKGDEYYKYILLFTINDKIQNKYNIDMLSIGLKFYDKYISDTNNNNNNDNDNNDNDDNLSDISDLSDISHFSEI